MTNTNIPLWLSGLLMMLGFGVAIALFTSTRALASTLTPFPSQALAPAVVAATDVITPVVTMVTGTVELGETITVHIDKLSNYIARTHKSPRDLVLFINGNPLKGMSPVALNSLLTEVSFYLERTVDNKDIWTKLLHRPDFRRRIDVSVGFSDETPFVASYNNPVYLTIIPTFWLAVIIICFGALVVLFVWLAKSSDIIRDSGPAPGGGKRKMYSLGRTQMAFWFFLVIVSYLFIGMITWDWDTLTGTVLGLLGISAGTALGAAIIDSSKLTAANSRIQTLEAERNTLNKMLSNLQAETHTSVSDVSKQFSLSNELEDKKQQLEKVNKELQELNSSVSPRSSQGFVIDVLTDANGISFHRFQIGVWTIVLGAIFVSSVYYNLSMPEFSGTILALMGISAGTYIGFKFPE